MIDHKARGVLAMLACGIAVLVPSGASAETLDSVRLKAEPDGIPAKIAAVANARGQIAITISTKKGGKFKERDRDGAKGADTKDGKASIEATQNGESYSRNGGEGLLSVGDGFAEYFRWNAKQGTISFYD